MYAPSPRSIVGTGLLAKLDIRVKCIQRCSAAFPEATDGISLLSLVMLGVLIGYLQRCSRSGAERSVVVNNHGRRNKASLM
jgi:hypothetical protein